MKMSFGCRPITFCLIFVLLLSVLGFCEDAQVSDNAETKDNRQLRINKNALLQGPSQQTRDDAAIELLLGEDSGSREALLSVLEAGDNESAVIAICNGLVGSRTENKAIPNKTDFILPLLNVLKTAKGKEAKLAAEAMLIFDFKDVRAQLGEIAQSQTAPKQSRLNAIYAVSLRQANKDAIAELVGLLDDPDKEIADVVSAALPYWVPKGMDRKDILSDLKRKSQEEIIRDRVVYLEEQLRKVSTERSKWLQFYLASLDKSFQALDGAGKGKMLSEYLQEDQEDVLKVWALNKVLAETASIEFTDGFAGSLVGLISYSDKEVRLSVANVLTKMSNFSSPEKLLEQLKSEKYDDVRLAIFEALGEACYYKLLSSTPENALSDEVRLETLTQADEYLKSNDPVKAKMGAVVIRKLIEPNGMDKDEVADHLEKILLRYNKADGELRSDLLNVMAKISGQSANRVAAGLLFRPSFVDGLNGNGDNLLKQAAVTGLANIDKAEAIELFAEMKLYDDQDSTVVSMVIQLAAEVGKESDLGWLTKKINANGLGEKAWQAMRQILLRQNAEVIVNWAEKLIASKSNSERIRELIEIAEQKALGQADKAAILTKLNDELTPALLKVYLEAGDNNRVTQVVTKRLASISENDKALAVIDGYLESAETKAEAKKTLLESLAGIKEFPSEANAKVWKSKLDNWNSKYLELKESKPESEVNEPADTEEKTE